MRRMPPTNAKTAIPASSSKEGAPSFHRRGPRYSGLGGCGHAGTLVGCTDIASATLSIVDRANERRMGAYVAPR